ncbi:MAG: hypothetical protein ABI967_02985 [bacterium]
MLWIFGATSLIVWLFLKFVLHKSGFIHIALVLGITLLVIQFLAYRKTNYHVGSHSR